MITLRRHENGRIRSSRAEERCSSCTILYSELVTRRHFIIAPAANGISRRQKLYDRFSIRDGKRSPARFTKSFLAKSLNLNALYRSRGLRRIWNACQSSAFLDTRVRARVAVREYLLKETPRVCHEMRKKVGPWQLRLQFQA